MEKYNSSKFIKFKNVSSYFFLISVLIISLLLIFGLLVPLLIYPEYFLHNFLYFFPYPIIVAFFILYRFSIYRRMATIELFDDRIIIERNQNKTTVLIKNIKSIQMESTIQRNLIVITTKNDLKIGLFNRNIREKKTDLFSVLSSNLKNTQN
ncbi:hypothetical protein ACNF42_02040 [Cuniculiplasma sp. SKW3]|uniref:hypothetical protein n=1 Tax=Cuniculiplasma sp. SKW3 TaxID=3400170 RepID=UPI003FD2BCCF